MDGVCNNLGDPLGGSAGTPLLRVAPPRYAANAPGTLADVPAMAPGIGLAAPRYLSNRLFNDLHCQAGAYTRPLLSST